MHREQAAASGRTRDADTAGGRHLCRRPFRTFRRLSPFILACWRDSSRGGQSTGSLECNNSLGSECRVPALISR